MPRGRWQMKALQVLVRSCGPVASRLGHHHSSVEAALLDFTKCPFAGKAGRVFVLINHCLLGFSGIPGETRWVSRDQQREVRARTHT